MPAMICLRT